MKATSVNPICLHRWKEYHTLYLLQAITIFCTSSCELQNRRWRHHFITRNRSFNQYMLEIWSRFSASLVTSKRSSLEFLVSIITSGTRRHQARWPPCGSCSVACHESSSPRSPKSCCPAIKPYTQPSARKHQILGIHTSWPSLPTGQM